MTAEATASIVSRLSENMAPPTASRRHEHADSSAREFISHQAHASNSEIISLIQLASRDLIHITLHQQLAKQPRAYEKRYQACGQGLARY